MRWGALAVGSTVGIASWATLYVWGAAAMCLVPTPDAARLHLVQLVLAAYGGLAASVALWLASAVASRAAGATSRQAGVLHGLAMWGMANITLVLAVLALGMGLGSAVQGPAAFILHVGAATVSGGTATLHGDAQVWATGPALLGMGLVMLTSLLFGVWGGLWGVAAFEADSGI